MLTGSATKNETKKNHPAISVVVPIYNVERYLDRCVKSILTQTFKDYELLLVDDGSPDNCGAMCDAYAQQDSRIQVIHKENGGLSDARNAGIDAACGRYLIFIDSDDFIDQTMLETLYRLVTEHDADMSVCGARDRREGEEPSKDRDDYEERILTGVEALGLTLEGKFLPGSICTKLIRREICLKHRFLKGKIYEDAFYTPQLFLRSKKVAATNRPFYNYWCRSGSITTKPFSDVNMDIVEAYMYTLEQVENFCPELEDLAMFRVYWANFVVMDKMLVTKNRKQLSQYLPVKQMLKKNWWNIFRCKHFTRSRRLAVLLLAIHIQLYRMTVLWQNKKFGV